MHPWIILYILGTMFFQTRIVGGVETGINEYPYMVGLVDTVRREVYCGASIISNRYVLSAAHCVYQRSVADLGALVGDHNLTSGITKSGFLRI